MVGKIGRLIGTKLGACSRCMRLSLLAAGLSWVAMLLSWNVFVIGAAVLFTALTLAHFVAFGIRRLKLAADEGGALTDGCSECSSRRSFLGLVARAIPLALLAQFVGAAPAAAQTATKRCRFNVQTKKCVGACRAFNPNGSVVKGVIACCNKVENEDRCCCQFLRFDRRCTRNANGQCVGECPPIFLSREDAAAGVNPIEGKCVEITIPGLEIRLCCICVYDSCQNRPQ